MNDFFNELGIPVSTFAAAVVGGLTGLAFIPGNLTIFQKFLSVIGGFGCAVYMPPVAFQYFDFLNPSSELVGGASFVMGVVGMNIMGGLVELSRRFRKDPSLPGVKIKEDGDND